MRCPMFSYGYSAEYWIVLPSTEDDGTMDDSILTGLAHAMNRKM